MAATQPTGAAPAPTGGAAKPGQQLVPVRKNRLSAEAGDQDDVELKEEAENVDKQRKEGDFSGEYGKQVYCRRQHMSLLPLLFIFIAAGKFPFTWKQKIDGIYAFEFRALSFLTFHFIFVALFKTVVLFVSLGGISHITLNITVLEDGWDGSEDYKIQREYEDILVRRYYIPLIYVFTSLIHGWFSTFMLLRKRLYVAHFYSFWNKAVYTMHMDISRVARDFSIKVAIVFVITSSSLFLLSAYKVGPTSSGLPLIFGDLLLRYVINGSDWLQTNNPTRTTVKVCGGFLLIFVFTGSKSTVVLFIYHCKLLQSSFAYWNGRVYAAVLRGGEFAQTPEGRTTYKLLFKDHCILMDLLEGMDQVYAFSLESYFGCQIISVFFEMYFCIRTAKHGDNREEAGYPKNSYEHAYFIRPYDWAPGLIMLCLSISLLYSASRSAAAVAEEAMAGLEVLRRRTMLGRRTDEELYFMQSMFASYTGYKRLEIAAGGYSYFNKDFILGLVSVVLSCFIILYQFQPVMDRSISMEKVDERGERIKFGQFLAIMEGLDMDHYDTTPAPIDKWDDFRTDL